MEVDYCVACGGVWLDRGELELLAGMALEKTPAVPFPHPRRGRRRCPRCQSRMRRGMLEGTEVELDACPRGHGLWFDRGELQDVLRARGAEGAAARMRDYFGQLFAKAPGMPAQGAPGTGGTSP